MIRRHMVRGFNEKIYYAETIGNAEKIYEIEFHRTHRDEISKDEIFQLVGTKVVAFEVDCESTQDDMSNNACSQSLYLMDDTQRIYHLYRE